MLVRSQNFPVQHNNLLDALQRIYSGKSIVSYLWVDAICINQGVDAAALKERSVQTASHSDPELPATWRNPPGVLYQVRHTPCP